MSGRFGAGRSNRQDNKQPSYFNAGEAGFEPAVMDPESIALPLGYSPIITIPVIISL